MKTNKKHFIMLMILAFAMVFMVGCGGSDTDVDNNSSATVTNDSPFASAELEVIFEELKDGFENFTMDEMTYEEMKDAYFDGIDGKHASMGDTTDAYTWTANDDALASVTLYFDDFGDGIRIGSGVSGYFP